MSKNINNFEWIEFGKVFTLEKGKLQSSKIEDINGDILFISTAVITTETRKIKYDEYLQGGIFIANAFNGNGKCPIRYTEEKCINSDLMLHCKINNNYINKINKKYIYYFLKSLQEHIEQNYQKGSCNLSLDQKNFNRMKVQIPSIIQQNKCIEKINEMEEIIKRWENDIDDILNKGSNKFLEYLECESIKYDNDKEELETNSNIVIHKDILETNSNIVNHKKKSKSKKVLI